MLYGREKTGDIRDEPGVQVLASDEFWHRISGIADFSARFLRASLVLAARLKERSQDDIERIKQEAVELFDDGEGLLDLQALVKPPKLARVANEPSAQLQLTIAD